jgi:hypothetical protein
VLVRNRFWVWDPAVMNSVGKEWSLRICMLNKFSDVAGSRTNCPDFSIGDKSSVNKSSKYFIQTICSCFTGFDMAGDYVSLTTIT